MKSEEKIMQFQKDVLKTAKRWSRGYGYGGKIEAAGEDLIVTITFPREALAEDDKSLWQKVKEKLF